MSACKHCGRPVEPVSSAAPKPLGQPIGGARMNPNLDYNECRRCGGVIWDLREHLCDDCAGEEDDEEEALNR